MSAAESSNSMGNFAAETFLTATSEPRAAGLSGMRRATM